MQTHKFKTTSGLECEVREFTGKHQRLLTEQGKSKMNAGLNEMLADIIVRLGDKTNFSVEDIEKLPAPDRKSILVHARAFTMSYDPMFKFTFKYVDSNGTERTHELEIEVVCEGITEMKEDETVPEGEEPVMLYKSVANGEEKWVKYEGDTFTAHPAQKIDEKGAVIGPLDVKSYEEVMESKNVAIKLPRSGQRIQFTRLDGQGEEIGAATKKKGRSSHLPLTMRKPAELLDLSPADEKNGKPKLRALDLDKMSIQDIEFLRKCIKKAEGQVDTEIIFEHPDADNQPESKKMVHVDVLTVVAFFYPSEAI